MTTDTAPSWTGSKLTRQQLTDEARKQARRLGLGEISEAEYELFDTFFQLRSAELTDFHRNGGRAGKQGSLFPPKLYQRRPATAERRHRRAILSHSARIPRELLSELTPGEQAVYELMRRDIEQFGFCDRSKDELAAMAFVSKTVVDNAVKRLENRRAFTITRRPVPGQKHRTNRYTFDTTSELGRQLAAENRLRRHKARKLNPDKRLKGDRVQFSRSLKKESIQKGLDPMKYSYSQSEQTASEGAPRPRGCRRGKPLHPRSSTTVRR